MPSGAGSRNGFRSGEVDGYGAPQAGRRRRRQHPVQLHDGANKSCWDAALTLQSPYRDLRVLRSELLTMVEDVLRLRQAQASVQASEADLPDIGPTGTISVQPTRNGAAAVHLEPSDHNTVFITIGEHCFCEYWHTDENADRLVPGVREIFEAVVAGDIYVERDIHDGVIGASHPQLKLAHRNRRCSPVLNPPTSSRDLAM
jgi:hypothetical protein